MREYTSDGLRCKACDESLNTSDRELCSECLRRVQEDLYCVNPRDFTPEDYQEDIYVSDITGEYVGWIRVEIQEDADV